MKNYFLPVFRLVIIVLFSLAFFNCEKDEVEVVEEALVQQLNKVQVNTNTEVSKKAISFIKTRTNNSFAVDNKKGRITLSEATISSKNATLGIVDTSKEIVVINETNTKHTFKVIDNDNDNKTFINLIIVETENSTYEYFVKYTLNEGVSIHDTEGNLDFSQFRGRIETFNSEGDIIGDISVEDGGITSQTGQLAPCPDEPVDDTNTNTNGEPTDGNNTSSSSTSAGVPGSDTNSSNTTNDNTTSGGWFASSDNDDCGLSWSYAQCGCGGTANGHEPSGPSCCEGSPLTITDCYGNVIAQGRGSNSATMFKRNPTDPCNDGDVGVILDEEELCAMDNESFNAYYSERSPFTVDMSDIRNSCDSISTPNPENEKFLCIYNKLTKSPTYKNIFNNVFGENENLNIKFKIDSLPNNQNGNPVNGIARRKSYTLDSQGEVTSLNINIIINKDLFDGSRLKTPFYIARVIIHESIHAYLYLKILNNAQGTNLAGLDEAAMEELLNEYFENVTDDNIGPSQHNFMANKMLPTISTILSDVRDDFIPENQRQHIENTDFYDFSQLPTIDGPLTSSTPFDWNDLYYHMSLVGLGSTQYYIDNITNDPVKNFLRSMYLNELNRLSKSCNN